MNNKKENKTIIKNRNIWRKGSGTQKTHNFVELQEIVFLSSQQKNIPPPDKNTQITKINMVSENVFVIFWNGFENLIL